MPRLLRTAARTAVIAGTATAVSGRVANRQQNRWAQQNAQAQAAAASAPVPAAAPAPAAAAGGDDMIEKLKQLADLHAQGILTDDEFAAQKAKILG